MAKVSTAEPIRLEEDLFTFPIPLPNNPLKWLNCYVLRGGPGERNLLVDTGFYRPECIAALEEGLRQLSLKPEDTDVFLSHLHSDHAGNARYLQDRGCRILMGARDYAIISLPSHNRWARSGQHVLREGMPLRQLERMRQENREVSVTSGDFEAVQLQDGDVLLVAGRELLCVLTPGHTPGHMCLYDRQGETMFLGDHVLFDISPNITFWMDVADPLGDYLDSLRAMLRFPVRLALPGHRTLPQIPIEERIVQLLHHHQWRLENMLQVLAEEPGLTAYELAGRMRWRIHAKSWETFPPGQQYFALGETLSHLDHLLLQGKLRRTEEPECPPRYSLL